ncbi:hypothetical protein CEXT_644191 [Caerostris extrusa]|uniref:Uncharacterized protein n=1 Tax=Caerostris extrusa TaxID=172846 RepID=A0AAV4TY82_CAEEX|nr:hypothetical protein CEXT_644191 [Caerostris extrusa]
MDPDAHLPKYPSNYQERRNRAIAVSCASSTTRKIVRVDTILPFCKDSTRRATFFLGMPASWRYRELFFIIGFCYVSFQPMTASEVFGEQKFLKEKFVSRAHHFSRHIGEKCWVDLWLSEMDPDVHLPKYPSNYQREEWCKSRYLHFFDFKKSSGGRTHFCPFCKKTAQDVPLFSWGRVPASWRYRELFFIIGFLLFFRSNP